MSLHDISAVMIVRNAEVTLGDTLQSLAGFGEVLVYDNGSSDECTGINSDTAHEPQ